MKTFRRVSVLGLFGALGMGVALCVGVSTNPSPSQDAFEAADRRSRPFRELLPSAAARSLPPPPVRLAATPGVFQPIEPPLAAVLASPSPARRNQVDAGSLDSLLSSDKGLMEVVNELKKHLSPEAKSAATAPEPVAAPAAAATAPAPAFPIRKEITRNHDGEGDDGLSINIQNTDIREVLDLLSQQGNLNILASPNVQGKVSATLNNVALENALDAILRSTGFLAKRDGKFIFVGTAQDFQDMEHALDKIGTRVYHPNYVTAAELQALIQPILTENVGVVSVTTAAEKGIGSDEAALGGDDFAGGDAVLVRDYEAVLAQVDQLVLEIDLRPMQVHIEAMILSVKLNDVGDFGVDFEMLRDSTNVKIGWGSPVENIADFKIDGDGLKVGFLDSSLGAFISALETVGDTNVIATPRLMVLNKHRAEIQIGEQKGYVNSTVTETSTSQSVEFLELGTILRIRPYISTDGLIRMEVHPEISDGNVTVQGQFTLPNKEVTQVSTNIMVRDGCTVVIGGLLKDQLQTSATQIPWFGNLPWVGPAFRTKKETTIRQEIIVLLTPRIVYEPDTCREGDEVACECHRRHRVYSNKMSPLGKRSLGRRYLRQAQNAWAAGDRKTALRKAELAVQFDPMSRAAIDLRSDIWQGKQFGDHALVAPPDASTMAHPLDGEAIAPWVLDSLAREPEQTPVPMHPLDPGRPGGHHDIECPRRLQ